jgi:hypothetical protein
MRPALKIFLFTICLLFASQAQAARFTGNYLIEMCASDVSGKEVVIGGHAICQAYIAGAIDYHELMQSLNLAPGIDFCIPEKVTMKDLQQIVLKYLINHRDQNGSFTAAPGIALAFHNAYPCRKGK